jgi:isopenicillin-N N-acyltransferase-like protein
MLLRCSDFHVVGCDLKREIRVSIENYRLLFEKSGLSLQQAEAMAVARYAPAIPAFLMEEMKALAHGAEVAFETVLALNSRTELLAIGEAKKRFNDVVPSSECTTVISGHLLAQNWDWIPNQKATITMLDVESAHHKRVVTLTEAGLLCKMGMNDAGLAVALNLIRSTQDAASSRTDDYSAVPIHLLLRWILCTCSSVADALLLIRSLKVDASSCFTMMDVSGACVIAEISPAGVFLAEGIGAHTNHFVAAPHLQLKPEETKESQSRLLSAVELLKATPQMTVDQLRKLLSFHNDNQKDGLTPICKHAAKDHAVTTLAVLIFDPKHRTCYLAPSTPCSDEEFKVFRVG